MGDGKRSEAGVCKCIITEGHGREEERMKGEEEEEERGIEDPC
jgi:hypothetical protein